MHPVASAIVLGVLSYLAGAIPFGLLLSRIRGIDVRTVGSGNIGATNVFRSVSKGLGIATFVLDAAKGMLPALGAHWATTRLGVSALNPDVLSVICGCAAVVGHNWPVYLKFKGGKGVATSAGALIGIAPLAAAIGFSLWGLTFLITRYVSVASLLAAVAVSATGWICFFFQGWNLLLPIVLTLLAAALIWRHKGNIQRLVQGTEHRFSFKKKPS